LLLSSNNRLFRWLVRGDVFGAGKSIDVNNERRLVVVRAVLFKRLVSRLDDGLVSVLFRKRFVCSGSRIKLLNRLGAGANLIPDVVKTDGATGEVEFERLGTTFSSLAVVVVVVAVDVDETFDGVYL